MSRRKGRKTPSHSEKPALEGLKPSQEEKEPSQEEEKSEEGLEPSIREVGEERQKVVDHLLSVMERVGTWMAASERRHLAEKARQEYLELTGRVNEEDVSFDRRMGLFLEYLLTEFRDPPELERSCLEEFADKEEAGLSQRDKYLLSCLSSSHRSIFELLEQRGKTTRLCDLLYGGQWTLNVETSLLGVDPGDIFEARLVGVDGHVELTQGFCHHPGEARHLAKRVVLTFLKRGVTPAQIMGKLSQMRLKLDRYHRMSLQQIYSC